MAEDGFAVLPVTQLPVSQICANQQDESRAGRPRRCPPAPGRGQPAQTPHQRQEKTDGGQVGVAVGNGLEANLHQADDRDQHAHKPKPACRQIAPRPTQP